MTLPGINIRTVSSSAGAAPSVAKDTDPSLTLTFNTALADIAFDICGITGKRVNVEIVNETNIPLVFNDDFQLVSYHTSEPRICIAKITGDIAYITDINIADKLNILGIGLAKLTRLETLLGNNSALSIAAIDGLLRSCTSVDDMPNLIHVGLHGQTPAAPPTLGIYNAFKAARGSMYSDVDVQPYNFKVVTTNASEGRTVSLALVGEIGKTIDILWGQTTATSRLVFDGTLQIISFTYGSIGTRLIRVTGEVDYIYVVSNDKVNQDKLTEFNPKNFSRIKAIQFYNTALTVSSVDGIMSALSIISDFPDLDIINVMQQIPYLIGPNEIIFNIFRANRPNVKQVTFGNNTFEVDYTTANSLLFLLKINGIPGSQSWVIWGDGKITYVQNDGAIHEITHLYAYPLTFGIDVCTDHIETLEINNPNIHTTSGIFTGAKHVILKGCGFSSDAIYWSILYETFNNAKNPELLTLDCSEQVPPVYFSRADVQSYIDFQPTTDLILDYLD